MGQKIHPLSLRVQSSTRYFDHAWYSDHFFSKLISIDISIFKYLKNFLTLLKLPTGRFSIYHLPKTTKLYSFFCYPKQSREYKSKIFNISSNLVDTKMKKHKFLTSNQFKSPRNSIVDPLLFKKILDQTHFNQKSQLSLLNSKLYSFSRVFKLDSIKISGNESKNLQKLFKETKSPIFEQQFTQYLVNSYKTSEFFLSKNSNAENNPCLSRINIEDTQYKTLINIPSYSVSNHNETLLILKKFLFFSKIFKMPYNVYKKSINNFQKSSNLWKYNANLETNLAKFMHSDVSLIPFQVNSEWQDAGYFADEIVFLLERRISFRQIKNRIFKQFSLNPYIQGVRITCSGRVGGKSKKAQRARVDSIKYGQTSLHIFSSRIDFAARTAYTSLGSTGVKVWVCYK